MPQAYKRIGATIAGGVISSPELLYTASATAGTSTVVSTIAVCNTAASPATYRICINTANGFAAAGYLVFNGTVAANDSIFLTLGVILDPVNRYLLSSASASTVTISAFGVENT